MACDMSTNELSGYADFEWAVQLNRFSLKMIGLWPEETGSSQEKLFSNLRFSCVIIVITCVCTTPSLYLLLKVWGDMMAMIDNILFTLPLLSLSMKLFIMWWKKEILPACNLSVRYVTNITDPGRLLPVQSRYTYDITKSPHYELTFISQNFEWAVQLNRFSLKMIGLWPKETGSSQEKLFSNLRFSCVIIVITCVCTTPSLYLLLKVWGDMMAMIDNILFTLPLLSLTMKLFIMWWKKEIICTAFTHMCLYCAAGELLVMKYEKVYNAVCECKWYTLETAEAKSLIFLLLRTNKPLYITAGKILPMTMSTFCSILKTSGGYISVLLANRN
nr:PREDICTED: uncharacterized protein LOC105671156 [Linepithema humile]